MESVNPENYTEENPLEIDGSILEGGGQILRISISLSYMLKIPIKIINIRKKRDNPGLQRQHLGCTQFITELYNSKKVTGLSLNSTEMTLVPTDLKIKKDNNKSIKCSLNSAGSVGLMIQELLPCSLFTSIIENNDGNNDNNKLSITLTGGTLVKFSPTIYYLNEVLFPILSKYMNINASCDIVRDGIYPIGLGEVVLNVEKMWGLKNENIHPINILERGKFLKSEIRFCYTSNFRFKVEPVCDTIYKGAKKIIRNEYIQNGIEFDESEIIKEERICLGNKYFTFYYQVVMIYENTRIKGDFMISEKKGNFIIDDIIDKCLDATFYTVKNYEVCLDEHTVDHLIIFMTLAKGVSKIKVGEISLHTQTAIEIVKKFIKNVKINIIPGEDKKNVTNIIEVEGIGY